MELIAHLKRIPLPALLGAAVAMTSYVVASLWKQEYDNAISRLRNYTQEIVSVRNTILTAHISKAVIYNFEDQISTMRMQVLYMKTLLPSENAALLDDSMLFTVSPTNNSVRWEISLIENEMLTRLLNPPREAKDPFVNLQDYVKTGWFTGIDDLKQCVKDSDTTPGAVFVSGMEKKLPGREANDAVPFTLRASDFAKRMAVRYANVRSAEITVQVPAVLSLLKDNPAAAMQARRLWEVIDAKCFDEFREGHDKVLGMVLNDLREHIDADVRPVYEKRRNWLQSAEVALYLLGILIALAKQSPSRAANDERSA